MKGQTRGENVNRYQTYRHLAGFAQSWAVDSRALSISGSQHLCRILGFAPEQIVDASYPESHMCALAFPDGQFDCVVSDQVLEHVEGDPLKAMDEAFRVLRPGGLAVHSTCLINPIHKCPGDFWRFTPDGLSFLCRGRGEILEASGWGNPYVWLYCWLGMRFEPVPHARWHPVHWLATRNRPEWPVTTWVVVRKAGAGSDDGERAATAASGTSATGVTRE